MAILRCKMCGADIELSADRTFGTCESCGNAMTFPKVDDEQRAAAFNRGNHFRRIGEFDKALAVYERIVNEDNTDAEAHWCCALCRFGIEYVEDPATFEWLPTCHRASFDSFLEDVDYLAALEHSDGITRRQYQKDGAKIAEVQRGILATSQNEEPYDVFICYKESDENGSRTKDSLMAQEIYYQLTEQGRKVFFSRITLEDMAGKQYEPYIFAALNSAKVMVVVGTKPEYLNAVWVKNEWSRFLAMMKKDRSKLLLPCYRDMDPYDLPEQLSVLQSYDMSKIGFIQDLTRGIAKVLDTDKPKAAAVKETVVVQQAASGNTAALLKRGSMALEDGDWARADEFFEEVLNQDAECAEAYIGKALVAEKCGSLEKLAQKRMSTAGNVQPNSLHLPADHRHADEMVNRYALKNYLEGSDVRRLYTDYDPAYDSYVQGRRHQRAEEEKYWQANKNLTRAARFATGDTAKALADAKGKVLNTMDRWVQEAVNAEAAAKARAEQKLADHVAKMDEKAKAMRADAEAKRHENYERQKNVVDTSREPEALNLAASRLEQFDQYLDSAELAVQGREKAKQIREELDQKAAQKRAEEKAAAEAKAKADAEAAAVRKKKNTVTGIIAAAVAVAVIAVIIVVSAVTKKSDYDAAMTLYKNKEYAAAAEVFIALGDYKDSAELVLEARYAEAMEQFNLGNYDQAADMFVKLEEYTDSREMLGRIREAKEALRLEQSYAQATQLLKEKKFASATEAFLALGDYSDSAEMAKEAQYQALDALAQLHMQFDLQECYVYTAIENGNIFGFNIEETFYNAIAEDFESACDLLFAEGYEVNLVETAHDEFTDVPNYIDGVLHCAFMEDFIEAGMKDLGAHKNAATYMEDVIGVYQAAQTEEAYANAMKLLENGDYQNAQAAFEALGDYKDSAKQLEQCKILPWVHAKTGDILTFGNYKDKNINWRVLTREGNRILLITESCVDERHFQSNQNKPKYYIDSPIRTFLNNTFYTKAFTESQQDMIVATNLKTTGGNVKDKVFILSDEEANAYFASNEDRKPADGSDWYLRTVNQVLLDVLNYYRPIAMYVTGDGTVYQNDWTVDYARGIRPAMWIDISSYMDQSEQ